MTSAPRWIAPAILCASATLAIPSAHAAWTDFLFGAKKSQPDKPAEASSQRVWRIGEFTAIQRAEREAGAPASQHPARFAPETIRQLLAPVRLVTSRGTQPLFAPDELNDLIEPLSEALASVGPDEDLLLLSTHRRGEGVLRAPLGLTARLFVHGDALHLIVHEARRDFVDAYIGSRITPTFTFGSRNKPGLASVQDPSAAQRRADWLAIPLNRAPAPAVAPPPVVLPAAAPAVPPQQLAPAAPPAPPRPAAPASADEIEQRLLTLKRLRERGLISEEEYQQKRREILQAL
ncbi:SHOCT domain-containing protein [uncultured Piscinibacter sp.]|uniref:SHOCT domain-containing protein n=1 Tax=uncultured Piscinibacter sp. TaxID=1131835 RepID=UPI0026116C10|nr:SHOCT domain-containing protein [uncultured Piscinibacter sp.]